jgi:indolepyruvate ferredoxin oxidoreductase beta subunit
MMNTSHEVVRSMDSFNVYITGVGGQGIGLLSEVILRAADYAGLKVKAVDTHGLAQRGGIVVSQIRMGQNVFTPIIAARTADLVIALERHEALRGLNTAIKNSGTLIYYNTVWQPLDIRLKKDTEITQEMITQVCRERDIQEFKVYDSSLEDKRMQNMAVLAVINQKRLIPGIEMAHYQNALEDLLQGNTLKRNLELFMRV